VAEWFMPSNSIIDDKMIAVISDEELVAVIRSANLG
jgi:hypothetical protein